MKNLSVCLLCKCGNKFSFVQTFGIKLSTFFVLENKKCTCDTLNYSLLISCASRGRVLNNAKVGFFRNIIIKCTFVGQKNLLKNEYERTS